MAEVYVCGSYHDRGVYVCEPYYDRGVYGEPYYGRGVCVWVIP